jgi:hypothetical protein
LTDISPSDLLSGKVAKLPRALDGLRIFLLWYSMDLLTPCRNRMMSWRHIRSACHSRMPGRGSFWCSFAGPARLGAVPSHQQTGRIRYMSALVCHGRWSLCDVSIPQVQEEVLKPAGKKVCAPACEHQRLCNGHITLFLSKGAEALNLMPFAWSAFPSACLTARRCRDTAFCWLGGHLVLRLLVLHFISLRLERLLSGFATCSLLLFPSLFCCSVPWACGCERGGHELSAALCCGRRRQCLGRLRAAAHGQPRRSHLPRMSLQLVCVGHTRPHAWQV